MKSREAIHRLRNAALVFLLGHLAYFMAQLLMCRNGYISEIAEIRYIQNAVDFVRQCKSMSNTYAFVGLILYTTTLSLMYMALFIFRWRELTNMWNKHIAPRFWKDAS